MGLSIQLSEQNSNLNSVPCGFNSLSPEPRRALSQPTRETHRRGDGEPVNLAPPSHPRQHLVPPFPAKSGARQGNPKEDQP